MASLDDVPTAVTDGTAGATGKAIDVATGVAGSGAGSTGAACATAIANTEEAMGATANAGAELPTDATYAAGAGTATVIASTRADSTGAPESTDTSTSMDAMVGTTNSGTARTMVISSQEDPDKTQASISLLVPNSNLSKYLYKTPTNEQLRLSAQLHSFLLQASPDLTQLNDAENKPVVGIINILK